jgi:hypothetical protein
LIRLGMFMPHAATNSEKSSLTADFT